jgi:hypothetical protein
MAWKYSQSSGNMASPTGAPAGTGYSGYEQWKNVPAMQIVQALGPIPQGLWIIHAAFDHPHLGPVVMPLEPYPETNTFGRSAFFIHGDSIARPGGASHGCIVMPRATREAIAESEDHDLCVEA